MSMSWPVLLRRVSGVSMKPGLVPGQIVVAWRWWCTLRPGNVVVVRHGGLEKLKRIARVDDDGVWLLGDNERASTDSRHFGALPRSAIIAKVIPRLRPKAQTWSDSQSQQGG